MDDIQVAQRFHMLDARRQGTLDKNRKCAELTIPSILPESGHTEDSDLPQPYQSEGANGVNQMAAKLLLSMFPPQIPNLTFEVSEEILEEFEREDPNIREEVVQRMLSAERIVQEELEISGARPKLYNALRYSVAVGEGCIFIPDDGPPKVFRQDKYVVCRDDSGKIRELIIKELFDRSVLSEEQLAAYDSLGGQGQEAVSATNKDDSVTVFTYVTFDWAKDEVKGCQYIGNNKVSDTDVTYKASESPWVVARWNEVDGENYGRGHVEENFGDLNTLEMLRKSLALSTAIAAKTVFLVNPNGVTNIKKLAETPLGGFVAGHPEDVNPLRIEKANDMQTALVLIQDITQQLRMVFLRNSAIQRQAERVTAEEIRLMAEELDVGLGGQHSRQSQEFQRPVMLRYVARARAKNKLPEFPKDVVKIKISTGLDAIGRGQNLGKLERGLQVLSVIPDAISELNIGNLVKRVFNSLGVDTDGLLKSAEQKQAEMEAAQQAQAQQTLMDKGTAPAVSAIASAMTQQG